MCNIKNIEKHYLIKTEFINKFVFITNIYMKYKFKHIN